MVNDRGSIKWTSLMLPEHVSLLEDLWKDDQKIKKPILDEQEWELINEKMIRAFKDKNEIQITVYRKGSTVNYQGQIEKYVMTTKQIILRLDPFEKVTVPLDDIISVKNV